ncbi:MAG: hypothetical protein M1833_005448 [Piccolia ochrophora]|nr:MAG: hypothetical protein M1833_005448 [Piccolia ochrophora]
MEYDMASDLAATCPLCGFTDEDPYVVLLHVESLHPEEENVVPSQSVNGFEVEQAPVAAYRSLNVEEADLCPPDGKEYVTCPENECGEAVLYSELETHIDMHLAERMTLDELEGSSDAEMLRTKKAKIRHESGEVNDSRIVTAPISTRHKTVLVSNGDEPRRKRDHSDLESVSWKQIFKGHGSSKTISRSSLPFPESRRLGKSELGPYAYESQMPAWLRKQVQAGGTVTAKNQIRPDGTIERITTVSNETVGLVQVLTQLSEQDDAVDRAIYCSSAVRSVAKMPREGGFCGYRNIQMLLSYIQETQAVGYVHFPGDTPNILYIQDLIEEAWERGFNSNGRAETGGIRGTRKYIGTQEVQALLASLNIPCHAKSYHQGKEKKKAARDSLLAALMTYFTGGCTQTLGKVHRTQLPPVYFQHQGHSLTIVGVERQKNGALNLIVFDPMFLPSPAICRLLGSKFSHRSPGTLLKAYRRGEMYLNKFDAFETLELEHNSAT